MLTGPELGAAIERAIIMKGVTKKAFADAMGVKPASVQDWIKYGRVAKSRIESIVEYFRDVADLEYWGLGYIRGTPGIGKAGTARAIAVGKRNYDLSHMVHGNAGVPPLSAVVAAIARAAIEAEAAGVPPQKLHAIHKMLNALRDAQKAILGASQRISEAAADAELPSDKEVEAALADLGLSTDRGTEKDGRSTNRGRHRKSG